MSHKKFSPAEKYKVALEAIKGELTQAQITSKYHVHSTQISKWRKQALEYLQAAFSSKLQVSSLLEDHEKQLAELYRQVGQLKVENDFLKKKCNLFE
jgi:transposase-like protein